tara:strand:- start:494 stop:1567 length:1074 start_codon:yes stop_codon:yes gene_type:complete
MFKNLAGQTWTVLAFNSTTGARVTGDAANITGKISRDDGTPGAITDTNPTEVEGGKYRFNLTGGSVDSETDADKLEIYATSTTSDVLVVGLPEVIYPRPANFTAMGIESSGAITALNGHTAQTGDSFARIGATGSGLSSLATAVSLVGMRAVVDEIFTDTHTTLDDKLDSILEDTGTSLVADITGVRSVVDTIDNNTDIEVAVVNAIAQKLDDTLEDNGGTYRFTAAALAASHATPTISQVQIPQSRTWQLSRDAAGGLSSEGPAFGMQVGEKLFFQVSYAGELGKGDWISSIDAIAIQTGTAGGVTFTSGDQGTNGALCKFSVTAVTAGSYTLRCKITSNNSDTIEADLALQVAAA